MLSYNIYRSKALFQSYNRFNVFSQKFSADVWQLKLSSKLAETIFLKDFFFLGLKTFFSSEYMEHTLYYRYVRRSLLTMLNLFLSTSLRKILSSPGVFLLLLFSRISIFHGYSYYSYIFIAAYTGKLTLPTTHIYISKNSFS